MSRSPDMPDAQLVEHHVPCVGCGYDLRGLVSDARCPECGRDVGDSLHGDLLEYADGVWLRTMYRGMLVLNIGTSVATLSLTLLIMATMLLSVLAMGAIAGWGLMLPLIVLYVLFAALAIGGLLSMVGAVIATKPEPRHIGSDATDVRYGTRFRIGLLVMFGVWIVAFGVRTALGMSAAFLGMTLSPMLFGMIAISLGGMSLAIIALPAHALTRYCADLARRLPENKILTRLRHRAVMLVVTICALALMIVGQRLSQLLGTGSGPTSTVFVLFGLGVLVCGIALLMGIGRFERDVRQLRRAIRDVIDERAVREIALVSELQDADHQVPAATDSIRAGGN